MIATRLVTYIGRDSKIEKPHTGAQANEDADTHRKTFRDVVGVLDA